MKGPKDSSKNAMLDAIEKTIMAELKEIAKKPETPLIDKMRIWDRALKVAALRMKLDEDDTGTGFEG